MQPSLKQRYQRLLFSLSFGLLTFGIALPTTAEQKTRNHDYNALIELLEIEPTTDLTHYYSPGPFVAEYELESDTFAIGGSGKRVLKSLGDGRYRMELVAKSIFLTTREVSQFRLDHCKITPQHYRYERTGIGRDRRYLLDFAKDLTSVEYEANKTRKTIPLDHDQYLDRLSETLALQCALARGETHVEMPIVDKDSTRMHTFKVKGEEVVETKTGKYKALRVERVRPPNSSRKTLLWFAPGLDFQLIKMVQIKEGRKFELTLSNYSLSAARRP